jgi:hypothetical protein
VLVFDGCMIRRDENKDITNELLAGLSVYVLEKTGYDIKFNEKDLDTSIDQSIYESPNNDIEASITYYKYKEDFEKKSKIIHPPIYISMI